jgi:peptide methionine sulfoxide reductase msrA/msrB
MKDSWFTKTAKWGLLILGLTGAAMALTLDEPPGRTLGGKVMARRLLTAEEERVIIHKGTETPFTGEYWNFDGVGTYRCRNCGAELFRSDWKFDAGCGWPSFDHAIEGAVKESVDADGRRTEITCAECGGHLGHVFRGERHTQRNTRHCVNSISLTFDDGSAGGAGENVGASEGTGSGSAGAATLGTAGTSFAYFAGGCFWGVEYQLESLPGVLDVESGYMGGSLKEPTYKQVCDGTTGHAETVKVTYQPAKVSYETLARRFFETHDPTHVDRQGPDMGPQYRSVVFYSTPDEQAIAWRLIERLKGKGLKVATKVEPASQFWPAEDYHQDYYSKTGKAPYCHQYKKRFDD